MNRVDAYHSFLSLLLWEILYFLSFLYFLRRSPPEVQDSLAVLEPLVLAVRVPRCACLARRADLVAQQPHVLRERWRVAVVEVADRERVVAQQPRDERRVLGAGEARVLEEEARRRNLVRGLCEALERRSHPSAVVADIVGVEFCVGSRQQRLEERADVARRVLREALHELVHLHEHRLLFLLRQRAHLVDAQNVFALHALRHRRELEVGHDVEPLLATAQARLGVERSIEAKHKQTPSGVRVLQVSGEEEVEELLQVHLRAPSGLYRLAAAAR
ncbi:hypothetical protein PybrP1_006269 [[Pythium] brassicae (nom. inval.)]|nr:hypothetical protein PybrP1_006269 [[Pythium] brassicae (nom. inval.)]